MGLIPRYSVGGRMVRVPEGVNVESTTNLVGGIEISRLVSTGSPKQLDSIRSKPENNAQII